MIKTMDSPLDIEEDLKINVMESCSCIASDKAEESSAKFCREQRSVTAWNVIGRMRQRRKQLTEAIQSSTRSQVRRETRREARREIFDELHSTSASSRDYSIARRLSRRWARRWARRDVREYAVRRAHKAVKRAVREARILFQESINYESDTGDNSDISHSEMSDVSDISGASQISAKSGSSGRSTIGSPDLSSSDTESEFEFEKVAPLSILCRRFFRDHYTIDQISQFDPFVLKLLEFVV